MYPQLQASGLARIVCLDLMRLLIVLLLWTSQSGRTGEYYGRHRVG